MAVFSEEVSDEGSEEYILEGIWVGTATGVTDHRAGMQHDIR